MSVEASTTATEKLPVVDTGAKRPRPTRPGWRDPRAVDALLSIIAVGAMLGLAHVRGIWVLQAAELVLLLTVPGILCLRAARVAPDAVRAFPLYVLGASLTLLMGAGLAVDLLGPPLGVSRPLDTAPLIDSLSIFCAVLILVSAVKHAPRLRAYLPVGFRTWPAWPLLLPVLAWIGAARLTNGHGNAVAIVALAATGVALLLGAWRAEKWSVVQTAILIYGAALALMLSFTLRGHYVYGFDIAGEYQTFLHVLHAGRWYASNRNDAYGAMLSLTILPTSFVKLTGASSLLVFKALYPVLFAFFPVGIFLLATRVLTRRFAYLGTLFIVVQNYLFQQLPAIARQELALLLFVCLVAAMFDRRLRRASHVVLLAVLCVGLVITHYGTTYVTVALFALAIAAELLRRLVALRFVSLAAPRVVLVPFVVSLVIVTGGAAIWDVAVTDSAQNLGQFFSTLGHQGLSVLPNSGGKNVIQAYLSGNAVTDVSSRRYAKDARKAYEHRSYIHPLPQAFSPRNQLVSTTVPGQRVKSHIALSALDTEQVLVTQIAGVLAAIGAFLLWLRRATGDTARSVALLAVATLAVLVGIRFSGTAALDYNQGRAFLQAMVPLSVCLGWMLQEGARRPRWGPAVAGISAVALGLVLFTTSGLRGPLIGGGSPTNVTNQGEDFERFYFSQQDFVAARWLNATAPAHDVIFTDRYGYLRFVNATGRSKSVFPDLTPETLDPNAWIYAYSANFLGRRARGEQGNDFAVYVWPPFVGRYWNLVYSNGSAGVYSHPH